jgi:glutamyl/glutaminyl-tRNA synthetase
MTEAALIKSAALEAVRTGMILQSEVAETIRAATFALQTSGSAYVCGRTIYRGAKAQDARKSAAIRNMSEAAFERFAYGL